MGGDLTVAILVFLGSAVVVMFCGAKLAVYGDALASLTGWGRLFVGSLLVALATSLPELSTNISAVTLDPPNPELAVGNVFGANMLNMFTLAAVALAFGGKKFIAQVAPEQGYLIVVAVVMTGGAILFGALKMGANTGEIGISSIVLIVFFVVGMFWVYKTRPQGDDDEEEDDPGMTLKKAWLLFGLVSAGVVISGFFLAWSSDEIADITGIASSTLGILLVSVVTTMPEASSTIAAAKMGAADLGVAGLFGSCAFNVTILFYADPFFRDGVLGNQTVPAHFVAGGVAVGMMLSALMLILARDRIKSGVMAVILGLMATAYIVGAVVVATVGGTEDDDDNSRSSPTSGQSIMTAQTPDE
jgi:cation:H+ antiporter